LKFYSHDELNEYTKNGHWLISYLGNDRYACMQYFTTPYSLSSQTIVFATYVTLKIYLMIVVVTLSISTTNSVQLSFAIEDILYPLHYLKIPVNE
jgi:energy-coupling factor transport system permease protein